MKKYLTLLLAVFAVSGCASLNPNVPAGEGWVSLFNGEDMNHFDMQPQHTKIWTVKDGTIDCSPLTTKMDGDKSLWTKAEYGDFEMKIDWRILRTTGKYNVPTVLPSGLHEKGADGKDIITPMDNADSGIYLRGTSKAQVNIWCWPVGSGEVYGYRMDAKQPASVRAGVTPNVNADKPVGEWNRFHITMKDDRLTVVLNGQMVLDNAALPDVPEAGRLALQHHGGYNPETKEWSPASSLVQFKNIYIRELK
jgi:hypothetical protein